MAIETFPQEGKKELRRQEGEEGSIERISRLLEEEAQTLREQGFPVTNDCRIDPLAFAELYGKDALERDARRVSEISSKFSDSSPQGENLLEAVKTLAFNRLWFPGKLVALRTSKFDDYVHGIDEMVFDLETKQPLAA